MQKTFYDCKAGDVIYSVSFGNKTLTRWQIIDISEGNTLKFLLVKLYEDTTSFRNSYRESKEFYFDGYASYKKIGDYTNNESYWCVNKDTIYDLFNEWIKQRREEENSFNHLIETTL